jgi:hypothetical protein
MGCANGMFDLRLDRVGALAYMIGSNEHEDLESCVGAQVQCAGDWASRSCLHLFSASILSCIANA